MDYPLFFPNWIPTSKYIKELQTPCNIKAAVTGVQDEGPEIRTYDDEDLIWRKKVMAAPRAFRPFKFPPYEWRRKLKTILEVAIEEDEEEPVVIPRKNSRNTSFLSRLRFLFFSCWGRNHH
ncbi:uncharacterized protein LOC143815184 isoform X1 [Ranitomeya variabilis]|uniref:uncharacterized protein LOC143815184 isoform X1 n=1 Tax=Ranitomeya variabilis TaxID=490064 RepID=UPI0040564B60